MSRQDTYLVKPVNSQSITVVGVFTQKNPNLFYTVLFTLITSCCNDIVDV